MKIDVDRNNTTAARFNIQSVPTLMLFRKGEVLWRRSGVTQSSELLQIINSYLN
ncbi:MAG: thioredoxin family protein [Candidatus Limimorpha sp.]